MQKKQRREKGEEGDKEDGGEKKEGKTETVRQTAIGKHSLETNMKAKINLLTSDTPSDVKILKAFEEVS